MAAIALTLRGIFNEVYISSAVRYDQLFPYGTHPDLDKYWSSENCTIIHDGNEYTRLEKIMTTLASSPLALSYLRVCCQNIKGKYNCSKCFKCLVTMIGLTCADVLPISKTFASRINIQKVKNMYYDYSLKYNLLGEEMIDMLKKQNKYPKLTFSRR